MNCSANIARGLKLRKGVDKTCSKHGRDEKII
jgi:hypothetical protein